MFKLFKLKTFTHRLRLNNQTGNILNIIYHFRLKKWNNFLIKVLKQLFQKHVRRKSYFKLVMPQETFLFFMKLLMLKMSVTLRGNLFF